MEVVELSLGRPAAGGGFVARGEDGRVVFVRHGLPGERVRALLTEERARFARADVIEVLEASPDRVEPACPMSGTGGCGGCDYSHVAIDAQRGIKAQLLAEQLERLAGIEADVVVEASSDTGLGQRTRVRYGVMGGGRLGMRRHRSHELVEVGACPLAAPAISELELEERAFPAGADVEAVALEGADAIAYVVGSTDEDDLAAPDELLEPCTTTVAGERFQVSPGSFWQVHRRAPELLTATVLGGLGLSEGDGVLDGYCGAGLFTLPIARRVGRQGRVVGIEASMSAAIDATANLAELPSARVLNAPLSPAVLGDSLRGITKAVLDPPRSGVDRRALEALLAHEPLERLVMVSCDPATLARDLARCMEAGFELEGLRAFDLFEHTEHLEAVATLSR